MDIWIWLGVFTITYLATGTIKNIGEIIKILREGI